jgi:hypothetical protein
VVSADSEASSSSSRHGLLESVNNDELVEVLSAVVNEVIDEVLNSTHRQPSIPGVVCEVITEIIRSDSLDVLKDDVKKPKEAKKQAVAEVSKKKKV